MKKLPLAALIALLSTPLLAAEPIEIGLSGSGKVIEGVAIDSPAGASSPESRTVLLIGGLTGNDGSVAWTKRALKRIESRKSARNVNVIAIPLANPDGATLNFPPTGVAYRENPESNALWRWIALHSPDSVEIFGDDAGLEKALKENPVAETGSIQLTHVHRTDEPVSTKLQGLPVSQAHEEMIRRRARTPRALAEELAKYYGHDFDQPLYIQAIALIAQIRLGHIDDVKRIVEPYLNGTKNSLERPSSLVLAGHTVFTELARKTGDARYIQMVKKAADLGFEADGSMKESMPFHDQYSDSLYMGTVIAAQAGALTGERKYFDLAARHVAFMQKLVLRPDGLYRHSPATEAAWARGNAFPAIGLALALPEFPKDHPDFPRLLGDFQAHMATLARFQNRDGLWRNVVDYPGAYAEVSATAMIGFAMLQGVNHGWLPAAQYRPVIDKAWRAVLERTGPEGHMVDSCESTARLKSVDEYVHRAALMGTEPRAGAMALMFATAMAGLD
ncbi:MAG: glycoside hydrolase family 88 protein [Gammaproteobacteria bacterium]